MILRPGSPSFLSCSSVGETVVISWMMIEAEMYGMMLSAKIAMRWMPPPENMLNMPRMPPAWVLEDLLPGGGIDAGQRNVGAEAVDQQRAEREPDALLQLLGLGRAPKVEIGRQLFRCRDHRELPSAPESLQVQAPSDYMGIRRLFRRLFTLSAARIVTEPPAFSTAATADFEAPAHRKLDLGLEFAVAEQPHAVLGAAQQAGLDQRRGVDVAGRVELAWRRSPSARGRD